MSEPVLISSSRISTHPGIILKEEFMEPLCISVLDVSRALNIPTAFLKRFINGREEITVSMTLKFAKAFNTSPEFWQNLNIQYQTSRLKSDEKYCDLLNNIKPFYN
jgi:addiction module HigA family antidote